jgi:DNA-binding GntR family transcriptional regulator
MRQRILDNEWTPGFRALEQELALSLGMSRTPVREAAIRLQKEGLVKVVPRHGITVLPVSVDDMRDIYDMLTALEPMAAELACAATPAKPE